MSADDVRRGLHLVCDVDGEEAERAGEFLRKAANGYNFFGCTQTLFNPQLVHRFLNDYDSKGYAERLPTKVFDLVLPTIEFCPFIECLLLSTVE